MAQGRTLQFLTLLIAVLLVCACSWRSRQITREMRAWAEQNGCQWREGPDEVRTEEDFFNTIDGAAQPIIDLGWKRSVFGTLAKGENPVRLTLHEMANPRVAVALFQQNVFEDTQAVALGDRAVYWDRGLFSKGILFQKGSLYCELLFDKGGEKGELLTLASSLEARLK